MPHTEAENWLPVKLLPENNLVRWMRFDEQPFTEPFFDETIIRNKLLFEKNRHQLLSVTSLQWLKQHSEVAAPPDLLIFHLSRSGSTLLAQLLGLDSETTVLAEVPLIDQLLAAGKFDELRTVVHLLRRNKGRLVIKTDSWHILHYETLRRIWPNVPAVVLYRHPAEILRSHRKLPGIQTIPGYLSKTQLPGVDPHLHPDQFFAALMCAFYSKLLALFNEAPELLPIHYGEGVEHLISRTIAHSGFVLTAEHTSLIEQRVQYNAKHPGEVFNEHSNAAIVPEELLEAESLYQQLLKKTKEFSRFN